MEHFPGWMVESAYRYLKAAEVSQQDSLQKDEALVNALAGMEIFLSSFVSTQDDNAGKANETYKLDMVLINAAHAELHQFGKVLTDKPDKHDVLTLFHAIPESTRRRVGLDRYESLIDQYRKVSTNPHERSSARSYDTILTRVLAELIPKVVEHYRKLGCQHMFIQFYGALRPNVEESFLDDLEGQP